MSGTKYMKSSTSKVVPAELEAGVNGLMDATGVNAVRNSLSQAQVKLRTNKKFQKVVAAVTILAVFADILGTAIVSPALSSLCAYAEGDASPYSRIMATPNATDAEKNA